MSVNMQNTKIMIYWKQKTKLLTFKYSINSKVINKNLKIIKRSIKN